MFSGWMVDKKAEKETLKELTKRLEEVADDTQLSSIGQIDFGVDMLSFHKNTPLLYALAWNRLKAAERLLLLDTQNIALNLKDGFPSCLNTPLILAAKTHATTLLELLVAKGARLDEQDYRGFTALHYACMHRDEKAIEVLLKANANRHLRDAFGRLPYDYYVMTITEADLAYRYGLDPINPTSIKACYDKAQDYAATQKKCLSALRWYVHFIMVNRPAMNDQRDLAQWHIDRQMPVYHAVAYSNMMRAYVLGRPDNNLAIEGQLYPDKRVINSYTEEAFDAYRSVLSLSLFVRPEQITQVGTGLWIEMSPLR